MRKMVKKAQAGNLGQYFAIFIGVLIVAFVFFILTDTLRDTLDDTFSTTVSDTNGTASLGVTDITSYTVKNGTGGNETVASAKYTFSASAGTITFTEANSNETGAVVVAGVYATSDTGYNATGNIETGMANATSQLPQAGTLIGIGVILAVIGLAVYGARRYGLF